MLSIIRFPQGPYNRDESNIGWQQKVDYDIDVAINDEDQTLTGSETITYTNNSQDPLKYLWMQLDGNRKMPDSDGNLADPSSPLDRMEFRRLESMLAATTFDGGFKITRCQDVTTNIALPYHDRENDDADRSTCSASARRIISIRRRLELQHR